MTEECFDPYGEDSLCKVTKVSFGIIGDALNPDELTERMGVKPSRALLKGQLIPRSERAGGGFFPAASGMWRVSSESAVDSTSTERHARYIINILEPHIHVLEEFLGKPEYSTAASIWWQTDLMDGGFSLSGNTLSRLGRLCDRVNVHFLGGGEGVTC